MRKRENFGDVDVGARGVEAQQTVSQLYKGLTEQYQEKQTVSEQQLYGLKCLVDLWGQRSDWVFWWRLRNVNEMPQANLQTDLLEQERLGHA